MIDRISRIFARWIIALQYIAPRLQRYAPNWNGRATRTELIFTLVVTILAHGLFARLLELITGPLDDLALISLTLLLVLPVAAAAVRRLHDSNRLGGTFIVLLIPYAGWLWMSYYLLQNGNSGPNEFGPDPRELRRSS